MWTFRSKSLFLIGRYLVNGRACNHFKVGTLGQLKVINETRSTNFRTTLSAHRQCLSWRGSIYDLNKPSNLTTVTKLSNLNNRGRQVLISFFIKESGNSWWKSKTICRLLVDLTRYSLRGNQYQLDSNTFTAFDWRLSVNVLCLLSKPATEAPSILPNQSSSLRVHLVKPLSMKPDSRNKKCSKC